MYKSGPPREGLTDTVMANTDIAMGKGACRSGMPAYGSMSLYILTFKWRIYVTSGEHNTRTYQSIEKTDITRTVAWHRPAPSTALSSEPRLSTLHDADGQ